MCFLFSFFMLIFFILTKTGLASHRRNRLLFPFCCVIESCDVSVAPLSQFFLIPLLLCMRNPLPFPFPNMLLYHFSLHWNTNVRLRIRTRPSTDLILLGKIRGSEFPQLPELCRLPPLYQVKGLCLKLCGSKLCFVNLPIRVFAMYDLCPLCVCVSELFAQYKLPDTQDSGSVLLREGKPPLLCVQSSFPS